MLEQKQGAMYCKLLTCLIKTTGQCSAPVKHGPMAATGVQSARYLHAVLWFPIWFTASAACDATCPDLNCHTLIGSSGTATKQAELQPG